MKNQERFNCVLNRKLPSDRLPMIEWASWWDKTVTNWQNEGLDKNLSGEDIHTHFGLDKHIQIWYGPRNGNCPQPATHGGALMVGEEDYETLKKICLYKTDDIENLRKQVSEIKKLHDAKQTIFWITLEGFFWFPRTLFGIEPHLYSFYDYPDLYHTMCKDLLDFNLMIIDEICNIATPDFMTIAEDMSYNHGPMMSKDTFYEFLAPYYRVLTAKLKEKGIRILVDTDGNVMPMLPWLIDVGVEGIIPLERQSGVDVNYIAKTYPDLIMMGGFDKTVMCKGEEAMRNEFMRIMPAMKSGRYIPSVDHQTPPDVSIENYKIYTKLLKEYATMAAIEKE